MKKFFQANMASLIASICDYLITILLKEFFGLVPKISGIIGLVGGGIINFYLCRNWVFQSKNVAAAHQAKRYLLIWSGSFVLNSFGYISIMSWTNWNYLVAKIFTSLTVAIAYNYPIQKNYVFKTSFIEKKLD